MLVDQIDVLWLAIGSQTHDLVFAGVDLEARIVGEGGIEQAERVGPLKLLVDLDVVPAPDAHRCGCPLADAVDREDGRFLERRRKERARGVRLVMLAVENRSVILKRVADLSSGEELLLDPERSGFQKLNEAARCNAKVSFENPLEFEQRLVVEADAIEVGGGDAGCSKAIVHSACGKRRVSLLARETLLLRRGNYVAVP